MLRKVVVDVREFMSPLPAVLHQQGLDVIPVTLEVGGLLACAWSNHSCNLAQQVSRALAEDVQL